MLMYTACHHVSWLYSGVWARFTTPGKVDRADKAYGTESTIVKTWPSGDLRPDWILREQGGVAGNAFLGRVNDEAAISH
jgi:hypothetical protein